MSDQEFRDDPDRGVDPLDAPHEDPGVESRDQEPEDIVLEELENEWEDEEADNEEE